MSVVTLVPAAASPETINALIHLLAQARAGLVVGIAVVAVHKINDYSVDCTGIARTYPTLTRGMIRRLDDELAKLT